MRLTSDVLLYRTMLLLKLNPAIQFLNLKPKLKILEILIMDVEFAGNFVFRKVILRIFVGIH